MKILLLGASGFLGSVLYEKWRGSGVDVFGTCCRNGGEGLYPVDVTDREALSALVRRERPDVVVWALMSGADEKRLIDEGLANLLDAVSQETRIVYISTDGVFSGEKGFYTEEDLPWIYPVENPLTAYCHAKRQGEQMLLDRHLNHVIVRTGPLYGRDARGNWDKRIAALLAALRNGDTIVRTSNLYRTFVHVDDLAEALQELAVSPIRGLLHAGPSVKESYYSFCAKVAAAFGFDAGLVREETLAPEDAEKRGLPLDTSLDTSKAGRLLVTRFRDVRDAASVWG